MRGEFDGFPCLMTPGLMTAVFRLWQARHLARDAGASPWQFAVEWQPGVEFSRSACNTLCSRPYMGCVDFNPLSAVTCPSKGGIP